MAISAEEFEKFCKIAKSYNIKKCIIGDLNLEFAEETAHFVRPSDNGSAAPTLTQGMPTEDQFQLWSTDYMPDKEPT
jgi:hypothetical protein